MKLTISYLTHVIKEEINKLFKEAYGMTSADAPMTVSSAAPEVQETPAAFDDTINWGPSEELRPDSWRDGAPKVHINKLYNPQGEEYFQVLHGYRDNDDRFQAYAPASNFKTGREAHDWASEIMRTVPAARPETSRRPSTLQRRPRKGIDIDN